MMALAATIGLLAIGLIAGQGQAKAAWSVFCNPVNLPTYGSYCYGAPRTAYQLMGWGDQHSVCVSVDQATRRCSAGPGHGVYTPTFGPFLVNPLIVNNAKGSNTAHGIVYQP